jgi:hypothetical protein
MLTLTKFHRLARERSEIMNHGFVSRQCASLDPGTDVM